MKSLKDISWLVDEEEYRKDSSLSYSTLARFAREGFNNLEHLFDKIETPSLTFGSAVDTILTDGYEAFEKRFFIGKFPNIPDSVIKVVKFLHDNYEYTAVEVIPNDIVAQATDLLGYNTHWKPETRVKKIKEVGSEYFQCLCEAIGKTVISTETAQQIAGAVNALKTSKLTSKYFNPNPFDADTEVFYQLKFKAVLDNVPYRCMADALYVDHSKKEIIPIDLKTTGKPEWDFYKSFIDWRYDIQARLYWRIIRYNLDNDPEWKDYKLCNYRFVVINKETLTPLEWEFPSTKQYGALNYGKNGQIELSDPFLYGRQLTKYLKEEPKVPIGINTDKPNDITNWLRTL